MQTPPERERDPSLLGTEKLHLAAETLLKGFESLRSKILKPDELKWRVTPGCLTCIWQQQEGSSSFCHFSSLFLHYFSTLHSVEISLGRLSKCGKSQTDLTRRGDSCQRAND